MYIFSIITFLGAFALKNISPAVDIKGMYTTNVIYCDPLLT